MEGNKIMAIGDVDGDKHADVISINNNQDTFFVHYYNAEKMDFDLLSTVDVDTSSSSINKITSIVIARDMQEL